MFAHFRYLDGPLAGQERVAAADFATLGRHPGSEVAFEPEADLEVSIRHAAVFRQGGGFMIRDLGSTNGTFVNEGRVRSDRPLEPGDVIRLGPTGPRIAFSVVSTVPPAPPSMIPRGASRVRPPSAGLDRIDAAVAENRTTQRVRVERRAKSRWQAIALGAFLMAIVVGGWLGWRNYRAEQAMDAERTALLGQVDALLAELRSSKAGTAPLSAALGRSQEEASRLRELVATGKFKPDSLATLGRAVTRGIAAERDVLRAAAFDPAGATGANRAAVGIVFAEFTDQKATSGSGFAVRSRGDTVWVVTNRHLVLDSAGVAAPRIGVMFNGTAQNFRGSVAKVDSTADVALVVVPLKGGAPVIRGLGANPAPSDPVAVVGFPLGLDMPADKDWRTVGVTATTLTGTVTAADATAIRIDGYGAQGSSGSAVFNGKGELVGIVFGGEKGSSGRIVYAVPVGAIRRVMPEGAK
ncbi:MAG: trypsin-like peptidase domain-containing protein [Gemmatimonadota bacterium]